MYPVSVGRAVSCHLGDFRLSLYKLNKSGSTLQCGNQWKEVLQLIRSKLDVIMHQLTCLSYIFYGVLE